VPALFLKKSAWVAFPPKTSARLKTLTYTLFHIFCLSTHDFLITKQGTITCFFLAQTNLPLIVCTCERVKKAILFHLILKPQIKIKIHEEIDKVIGTFSVSATCTCTKRWAIKIEINNSENLSCFPLQEFPSVIFPFCTLSVVFDCVFTKL